VDGLTHILRTKVLRVANDR